MPKTTFAAAIWMAKPGVATKKLGQCRTRIAQIDAGVIVGVHANRDEALNMHDRLELACRETGRCQRCGRELTDPVSVAQGVGRDCLRELQQRAEAEDFARTHTKPAPAVETNEPF